MDLVVVWYGLIGFAVLAYVVLDGFDIGIGILLPWVKKPQHRDVMINSVAPVWDGNETWLILGGGGLFAAFPLAYAVIMPALYAPLIIMLLGLIFRGVVFEYRFRTKRGKKMWDIGFSTGSVVAAFCQGIVLGALIQGIAVEGREYAGGWFDWFTPFSVLTGIAVIVGYALLGSTWLIMKTDGELQQQFFRYTSPLGVTVIGFIVLVSLWTPLLDEAILARWFSWPNIALFSPVPLLVAAATYALYWTIRQGHERLPFLLTLGLFILSFVGLCISIFPYIVPRSITIWDAAAPESSLVFMLIGTSILLPLIIGYTAYAYWIFRGKVDPNASYH